MAGFMPDWKVALILIAFGGFLIYKGMKAVTTEEYTGKWGKKLTGKSAKILGWLNISIGGLFVLAGVIDLIMRTVSGF